MEVVRAAQALFVLWIGMDTTFEDSKLRRRALRSLRVALVFYTPVALAFLILLQKA